MNLKIAVATIAIAATLAPLAGAQTNRLSSVPEKIRLAQVRTAPAQQTQNPLTRTWTFQQGGKVEAWFVGFQGTNQVIVRKPTENKNYALTISALSSGDQVYVAEMQALQRQARLDADAKKMAQADMVEFTTKLIHNFPEKVDGRRGWMDATFSGLTEHHVNTRLALGFSVDDKNRDLYLRCFVDKGFFEKSPNPLVSVITGLKRGDKVRLIGRVGASIYSDDARCFQVEKVEMIESAAEKSAKQEAADK